MKQTLSVGMTAATFLMSIALAAQAPTPQQPPAPAPQTPTAAPQTPATPQTPSQPPSQPAQRAESAAGKITVNGCIEKASQPATAGFMLTNAMNGPASTAPVGTSGTSSTASASAGTSYRLDADEDKLTPHVGHRVEIVGTTMPTADSPSARPAEPGAAPAANLKVESITMVSQTCAK